MSKEESLKSSGSGEVYDRRNRVEDQMASSYTEIAFQAQNPLNSTRIIDEAEQTNEEDTLGSEDKPHTFSRGNYSDESTSAGKHPKRPATLMYDMAFPYDLDGTVRREGEMTHFVAENLEYKLKLSSPITKRDVNSSNVLSKNSTPSMSTGLPQRHFIQSQLAHIDSNVLTDIEIDAQYLAASVDNLTENLYNLLRSISSITADNVEIHKNSVNKLTDNMDANIKCMYTIMAKTEEISKSMKPTEQLAVRIREIKRLVDMLENNL